MLKFQKWKEMYSSPIYWWIYRNYIFFIKRVNNTVFIYVDWFILSFFIYASKFVSLGIAWCSIKTQNDRVYVIFDLATWKECAFVPHNLFRISYTTKNKMPINLAFYFPLLKELYPVWVPNPRIALSWRSLISRAHISLSCI